MVHRHLLRVGHVLYVAFGNDRLHRHLEKTVRQSVQKSPGFLHVGTSSALTLQTYLQVRIVIGEYQIENIAGRAELHRAVRIVFRHVVSYLLLRLPQGFPVLRLKVDHSFGRGKVFGMGQHEILHADHRRRSLHQSVHLLQHIPHTDIVLLHRNTRVPVYFHQRIVMLHIRKTFFLQPFIDKEDGRDSQTKSRHALHRIP